MKRKAAMSNKERAVRYKRTLGDPGYYGCWALFALALMSLALSDQFLTRMIDAGVKVFGPLYQVVTQLLR